MDELSEETGTTILAARDGMKKFDLAELEGTEIPRLSRRIYP
jgi:hypothetical protein